MQRNAPVLDIPNAYYDGVVAHMRPRVHLDPDSDCILYTGALTAKGYGRFPVTRNGKLINFRAHRVAWILTYGPIPSPELSVDHLCRTRSCVNPDHLELVTREENLARGARSRTYNRPNDPACPNGHDWSRNAAWESNGARTPSDRLRYCLQCRREGYRFGDWGRRR